MCFNPTNGLRRADVSPYTTANGCWRPAATLRRRSYGAKSHAYGMDSNNYARSSNYA